MLAGCRSLPRCARDGRAAGAGLAATGDEAAAVTVLAGALTLACQQGYVRVLADEGPPMAALLGRLIAAQRTGQAAAGVPLGYLARLQRAFGSGLPARDPVPAGIVDPLTSRELEILAMLAAGRSNQAIASDLVVTLAARKPHSKFHSDSASIPSGNAYDFSRDLSTIVYARPGGQQDLYLLSQK